MYRGSEFKGSPILDLGSRWRWVIVLNPGLLCIGEGRGHPLDRKVYRPQGRCRCGVMKKEAGLLGIGTRSFRQSFY
jgi:hypothetical protein